MPSVLLINMPFSNAAEPSMGLSILKPVLKKTNISSEILYLNITFRAYCRNYSGYDIFSGKHWLGEWVFGPELYGPSWAQSGRGGKDYLKKQLKSRNDLDDQDELIDIPSRFRLKAGPFRNQCTFCGLNADHLCYRSKEPARALAEIDTLTRRYRNKGTNMLLSLRFLKWCRELGLYPRWNFMHTFPGEKAEPYRRVARLAPFLTHRQPPGYLLPVHLQRFSLLFNFPERFSINKIMVNPATNGSAPLKKISCFAWPIALNMKK